jgi:uncharacterized protein (TIGR00369 family)
MEITLEDIISGAGGNAGNMREALGINITEYGPEQVIATMPVTWKVQQPFGRLHGGASVVLAETAATAGTYQFLDLSRQTAVGLEINANHLRGVFEGTVRAVAKPLHVGRKTAVWDIRILDDQDHLICISRCTIAIIDRYV